MSSEITTAFVKQYTDGIRMLQQQTDSRLKGCVKMEEPVEGDRAFFDQVDATAMNEVTNRHGDTEYTDTPHRRRMVTLKTYEVADLVDRADRRRLLNNPVNAYSRAMAAAANRRCDDIIIAAFDATAYTGVDGATSSAFDSTNFEVGDDVDGSAGDLSITSLTTAREILEEYENIEDDGDHTWHYVTSAKGRKSLLGTTQITSADYNTVRALVNGQINTYLGFDFVKSQRLPVDSNDHRYDFAWVKASMCLAVSQTARGFMDVLPQKRHSIQVRYEMDAGSSRMDEKGVVRVVADQSP